MRKYIILMLSLTTSTLMAHDVALATFHMSQEKNHILLEMNLDRFDLEKAIQEFAGYMISERQESQVFQVYLERYLDQHLSWEIDGRMICHEIQLIQKDEEYYRIRAILPEVPREPSKVSVHNDCLVSEIKNHSNVIYAHFYDKTRGFRLHQKRKVAIIDYN